MGLRELFTALAGRGYACRPGGDTCWLQDDPDFITLRRAAEAQYNRPRIICLCGSTRFYDAWQQANFDLTVAGNIVLSVGFYPHAADKAHAAHVGITPEQKVALDVLHKHKIDLADEVLVLNVGGYIGESTNSEIEHALRTGKPVKYLEPVGARSATRPFVDPDPGCRILSINQAWDNFKKAAKAMCRPAGGHI